VAVRLDCLLSYLHMRTGRNTKICLFDVKCQKSLPRGPWCSHDERFCTIGNSVMSSKEVMFNLLHRL
jgi:hypothetical protein